ncbi:MAG: hypothetical protein ACJ711_14935, partial [Ornithinibacter sp.]
YGTTAFAKVGLGRAADQRLGAVPGDPEHDPYVVEPGPGRGLGEVGLATDDAPHVGLGGDGRDDDEPVDGAVADTGPLVRPGKETAA